jgi:hypothetical protein
VKRARLLAKASDAAATHAFYHRNPMSGAGRREGDASQDAVIELSADMVKRLEAARPGDSVALSEAYRKVLRAYREVVTTGNLASNAWRGLTRDALGYLGGQSDRASGSMRDYRNDRYGPFLAISNEGGGAPIVREVATRTPKARALGSHCSPLTLGVAIDGERLGAVGEVPIGPDEFAAIWFEAVGRLLMTTNVGSRANLRFYKRPPIINLANAAPEAALAEAQADLALAFKPFLTAPGGPRPLTVFVDPGPTRSANEAVELLQSLKAILRQGQIARPEIHELGLHAVIGAESAGRDQALAAIDLAVRSDLTRVTLDGIVRAEAAAAVSLPGLLTYLSPELLAPVLAKAKARGIAVESANQVDPDTVAREVWSSLNTARSMGFDLGKYSLFPLTLAQSEAVIGQVQAWFDDWSAAPVFYADQGILTAERLYAGAETSQGIEAWLRMVVRQRVPLVLIDTVDKSKGWKLVKAGDDPKGLLTFQEIARLDLIAGDLGVKVMWAGGIEPVDAYELGRLGVFGIYVTTAVCDSVPVTGDAYVRDPALAALKRPNAEKILQVKTLLEAGFFASDRVKIPDALALHLRDAKDDLPQLQELLPHAWAAWWSGTA